MKPWTVRDLEDLGDERFEDLVAALVMREHDGADHLGAPDGGADVLLERAPERPKVWQVKHHPKRISWSKCEKSLDAAVETFDPGEVVFAFPCKMTSKRRTHFENCLGARHEGVEVTHISGPQILDRLRNPDNQDLIREFFDRDPDELATEIVERVGAEFTLAPHDPQLVRFAQLQNAALRDRRFKSQIHTSIGTTPEPDWDPAPYIVTSVGSPGSEVQVASWATEGAEVELPALHFTDDEAGERARQVARQCLARGEKARLEEGVVMRLEMPEAAKAAMPDDLADWGSGVVLIRAKSPDRVRVAAAPGGVPVEREMDVFQVPPPPHQEGERVLSFGGVERGLEFFMDLHLDREPRVRANFNFSLDQEAELPDLVEAGKLLLAFLDGEAELTTDLLPEGEDRPRPDPDQIDNKEINRLRALIAFEDAMATIREETGVEPARPDPLPVEGIERAIFVAEVLRDGKGKLNLSSLSGSVPIEESSDFLERHDSSSVARLPLRVDVFDTVIDLGIAEGTIRKPDLVVPTTPVDGQKGFEVRWTAPAEFVFEIVDREE